MFLYGAVISDLFQETVLLNPCFMCFKNLMLSFINKVTTGTKSLALFIWNAAPNVDVVGSAGVGGAAGGLATTAAVLDISDIIEFPDSDIWCSVLQLIKSKWRDL